MDEFILEKAFYLLNVGYILHVETEHGGGEIWKNGDYFHYQHFGSSAIKTNKVELQWLFETIFKSYKFRVFSNWNDIHLSYLCHNKRSLWIFSDGEYSGYNPYGEA